MTSDCAHVDQIVAAEPETRGECPGCVAEGSTWVHLRSCLTCGHVGCCDSSPATHATAHFRATGHPLARSVEPGESWGWCYEDEVVIPGRELGVGS